MGSTKIVKTPLYEKWGPAITAPAKLKSFEDEDGVRIFPKHIALETYGG